jgi:YopT peptidase
VSHIFNQVIDAVLSNRAKALRSSAPGHGCEYVVPFSQCEPPVSTWLSSRYSMNREVAGGICSALSSHWIYHHAAGSSLWAWLYPGISGPNGGVPHAGRLNQLMLAQAYGQSAPSQEGFEDGWLESKGIIRRHNQMTQMTTAIPKLNIQAAFESAHAVKAPEATGPRRTPGALGAALTETGVARFGSSIRSDGTKQVGAGGTWVDFGQKDVTSPVVGVYKRISVSSMIGAHCMALWAADDACFFDPNFGEFYFPSIQDFGQWFEGVFWPQSSYRTILNGVWSVSEFGATHTPGTR